MWERFGGVDISLDPYSFGQANTLVCVIKIVFIHVELIHVQQD